MKNIWQILGIVIVVLGIVFFVEREIVAISQQIHVSSQSTIP